MLRLAAVHPTPRRALRRVVKRRNNNNNNNHTASITADGDGSSDNGDNNEVRSAVDVDCTDACSDGHGSSAVKYEVKVETHAVDDDSATDSDYTVGDDDTNSLDSDEQAEEIDSNAHRQALQDELDECADEGQDVYLTRMLAARESLEGDDAAWVDRFVALQQQWKERNSYSIDAFDLDVTVRAENHRARHRKRANRSKRARAKTTATRMHAKTTAKQRARRAYARCLRAFWRFWYVRVAPRLPRELQEERAEYVVALCAALAFVVVSLAIQLGTVLHALAPLTAAAADGSGKEAGRSV